MKLVEKGRPRLPGQDTGVWVGTTLPEGVQPDKAEWMVLGRMVVQGPRFVITELRLVAASGRATPPGGITQDVVRRVPYGRFGPFVQGQLSFARTSGVGGLGTHLTAALERQLGALPTERPRPARAKGHDDRFYAEVARDYVKTIGRGSKSPIKDLAAARRDPVSRVRDMVRAARERGLLSLSTQGSAAGHLLPRAHELLGTGKTRRKVKA